MNSFYDVLSLNKTQCCRSRSWPRGVGLGLDLGLNLTSASVLFSVCSSASFTVVLLHYTVTDGSMCEMVLNKR